MSPRLTDAEAACVQMLVFHASILADKLIPEAGNADDLDAVVTMLLKNALSAVKPEKKASGRPEVDWEKLTGVSLDRLIYEARQASWREVGIVSDSPPPWKEICRSIVEPRMKVRDPALGDDKFEDAVRAATAHLADHLKPSKLRARYPVETRPFDGALTFTWGDAAD